jgi:hypothetical protein
MISEYATGIGFFAGFVLGSLWGWMLSHFENKRLREANKRLTERNVELETLDRERLTDVREADKRTFANDRIWQEFQRSMTNGGD